MAQERVAGWQVYRRLIRYSIVYWPYLVIAVVGLIAGALMQPLFAWVIGPLLDKAILQRDPVVIQWLPLGILGIFFIRGIAMFVSSYCMALVGRSVVQTIRGDVFRHLLHLPVAYFQQHPPGKLLSQLTHYTDQLANASTRGVTVLIQETATVIGLLGLMFYRSWQLSLGFLLIIPLIVLVILYATKRLRRLSKRAQNSMSDVTQIGNEVIRGYRVARIFGGEAYEAQRFEAVSRQNMQLEMKRLMTELLSTPLVQFLVAVALAAMVYIATRPSTLDTLSPGIFMSFISAMIFLLTPLRNLTQLNAQLQTAIAAGESVFKLLDEPSEPDQGQLLPERVSGRVVFDQVGFSYEQTDKPALKNISFSVEAGQKIALVGRSGSGKTTLANLLVRFYDYQQGNIYLDGMKLPDIKLKALRQQMAYVGQDIVLFNDTVRNNIAYGVMQSASEERILAAAKAAHALEFIEQLPQGLNTVIGDNGVMLSGGQRQRLAIARAILADAPILILDEATSALDTESERQIKAGLDHLLRGRTTFMIAHRLSTIENADRIVVLDAGEMVESGTHTELIRLNGHYAKLYAAQFNEPLAA
ncbi:lipid A export permease/ATP-binding protein MsbA [Thiolinea disciformis]|uniref:lipid A export permease/ATP-binding protein MsbA n=1 Tax=Thiolinea disciformis TaxID=125614 RepID=UPI0003829022|nr:lipid A export permease/ATP-binding protein MsbA [Thiolinea disciformis]